MNLATVAEGGGLVVVLISVVTLYVQLRDRIRTRIEKENERRAQQLEAAEERGRRSRDDEFAVLRASSDAQAALLRSQRDDARRDRDEAQRRVEELERRFNDRRSGGDS